MSAQFYARGAVALTALILFAGAGYLGYRFIQDVGRSAEQIESRVGPPVSGDTEVNSATLSANSGSETFSGSFNTTSAPDGVNNGKDVVIGAGELVYRDGRPTVRAKLVNQGGFTVTAVFLNLSLYLDKSEEAAAKVVALPVPLAAPLAVGGETVVNIPVADEAWRTPTVERAAARRVLAQVVGVADGDRDNADYPQLSAAVVLSQTQNNWTQPAAASQVLQEQPLHELRPGAASSPNIRVDAAEAAGTEEETAAEPMSLEQARELLNPAQPTGEARILSVEVHEYKNEEAQGGGKQGK